MAIRILKHPDPPAKYHGSCSTCRAEVEFDETDGEASPDPRDINDAVRYIACPIPGCHGQVFGARIAPRRRAQVSL